MGRWHIVRNSYISQLWHVALQPVELQNPLQQPMQQSDVMAGVKWTAPSKLYVPGSLPPG
jgi:hypothetical protein